jgi:hypothetical protein
MPFSTNIFAYYPLAQIGNSLNLKMTEFWDTAPCSFIKVDPGDGSSTHLFNVD